MKTLLIASAIALATLGSARAENPLAGTYSIHQVMCLTIQGGIASTLDCTADHTQNQIVLTETAPKAITLIEKSTTGTISEYTLSEYIKRSTSPEGSIVEREYFRFSENGFEHHYFRRLNGEDTQTQEVRFFVTPTERYSHILRISKWNDTSSAQKSVVYYLNK